MGRCRRIGDEVVIAGPGHSSRSPCRRGEILEVRGNLLRVRWGDETETVLVDDPAERDGRARTRRRTHRASNRDFIG